MNWIYSDGGRGLSGFKGNARDCVCRSIAIITQKPYRDVYDQLNQASGYERTRFGGNKSSSRNGVRRETIYRYLTSLGLRWTPTMHIGSGCTVHLLAEELPLGRLIISLSKHYTAMIDHVIYDTYDPQRGETFWYNEAGKVDHISPERCVYGYWSMPPNEVDQLLTSVRTPNGTTGGGRR